MGEWYGYRLLRGREGEGGYLRGQGEKTLLSARNLRPNTEYRWFSGDDEPQTVQSGEKGALLQLVPNGVDGFLACGEGVVLWPDGEDQALFFFRAQERLKKELNPKPENGAEETGAAPADQTAAQTPGEKQETPRPSAPRDENAAQVTREAGEEPLQEAPGEAPMLRSFHDAEPAFSLPLLIWPGEIASWKSFFEKGAAFSPFDAPGWRYVKAPSPAPGVPFCGLGVQIQGRGIHQAAYLLPGNAALPPAGLRGARFERGKDGAGYWVVRKTLNEI